MIVNRTNFKTVLQDLMTESHNRWNQMEVCVSSGDVRRAVAIDRLIDHMFASLNESGYCVQRVCAPILAEDPAVYGALSVAEKPEQKGALDDAFTLDLSDYQDTLDLVHWQTAG